MESPAVPSAASSINTKTTGDADENRKTLEKFGQDLTRKAREGKLDPVIGRDDEIRRTIEILSVGKKNNPVLIGEPGVGKTAIVEGLARRIVALRCAGIPEEQDPVCPGPGFSGGRCQVQRGI